MSEESKKNRQEYMKQYTIENKEHIKELKRSAWKNMPEEKKARVRKRRAELYRQDPSKKKKSAKKYYEKNRDEIIRKQKARFGESTQFRVLKHAFLDLYGDSCKCCGEKTYEFLCLDHVKGVNRAKKGRRDSAYRDAVNSYNPEEYRVLCCNCNQATNNGRICPHQINNHVNTNH